MTRIVIIGAGLGGLLRAWQMLRAEPTLDLTVVEAQPEPGGCIRSFRSEGFQGEHGPQFLRHGPGLGELLAQLGMRSISIDLPPDDTAMGRLLQVAVDPRDREGPLTLTGGLESLIQGLRRRLGARLLLGNRVVAVHQQGSVHEIHLDGQVARTMHAERIVLAMHPEWAQVIVAPERSPRGEVAQHAALPLQNTFLGYWASDLRMVNPWLTGESALPFRAVITTLGGQSSGRGLVRLVADQAATDPTVMVAKATEFAQTRLGIANQPLFRRVTPWPTLLHPPWPATQLTSWCNRLPAGLSLDPSSATDW